MCSVAGFVLFFCNSLIQNYEWYYNEEEEINVKLNIFAVNMEKAYGGKNDLRNQLGIESDAGEELLFSDYYYYYYYYYYLALFMSRTVF